MSDQGDAEQWRSATRHSGQHSTPDEAVGPIPVVPGDEADAPGFPPTGGSGAWAGEGGAPAGGFPSVPASDESWSASAWPKSGSGGAGEPGGRAPFEPADPPPAPPSYDPPAPPPYGSADSSSSYDDASPNGSASDARPEAFSAGGPAHDAGESPAGEGQGSAYGRSGGAEERFADDQATGRYSTDWASPAATPERDDDAVSTPPVGSQVPSSSDDPERGPGHAGFDSDRSAGEQGHEPPDPAFGAPSGGRFGSFGEDGHGSAAAAHDDAERFGSDDGYDSAGDATGLSSAGRHSSGAAVGSHDEDGQEATPDRHSSGADLGSFGVDEPAPGRRSSGAGRGSYAKEPYPLAHDAGPASAGRHSSDGGFGGYSDDAYGPPRGNGAAGGLSGVGFGADAQAALGRYSSGERFASSAEEGHDASSPGPATSPYDAPFDRPGLSAEGSASATGTLESPGAPLPRGRGVSAEDEAAENDFFASDDHSPKWDKVVAPAGPPPQPGRPSSGNLRLPDWMRDEGDGRPGAPASAGGFEEEGPSRLKLFLGVGLLVLAIVVAGAVYVLNGGDAKSVSATSGAGRSSKTPSAPESPQPQPRKELARFKGAHTAVAGRVLDPRAKLSYPRLGRPWEPATRRSPMNELGFNMSQFAVTEKVGGQPQRWARLMSTPLGGAEKNLYDGPGTERAAATQVADLYETRMYGFRHHKKLLASQSLSVDGHRGWLVGYYLTYHRPGIKATGEIVTVALVDTGGKTPGVLFMSVPNTARKLWPDVNFVTQNLKVV